VRAQDLPFSHPPFPLGPVSSSRDSPSLSLTALAPHLRENLFWSVTLFPSARLAHFLVVSTRMSPSTTAAVLDSSDLELTFISLLPELIEGNRRPEQANSNTLFSHNNRSYVPSPIHGLQVLRFFHKLRPSSDCCLHTGTQYRAEQRYGNVHHAEDAHIAHKMMDSPEGRV